VPRRAGTQARGDSYPHTSVVLLVQPTGQNRPEPKRARRLRRHWGIADDVLRDLFKRGTHRWGL
jgi:hypothetical protein